MKKIDKRTRRKQLKKKKEIKEIEKEDIAEGEGSDDNAREHMFFFSFYVFF